MKIGTILGVLAAAAAVAAIAIAAPARAEVNEKPASTVVVAREAAAAERPGIGAPAWLLMLTGFVGLGAMLRAARPAFQD
jgi:hypothetical protein